MRHTPELVAASAAFAATMILSTCSAALAAGSTGTPVPQRPAPNATVSAAHALPTAASTGPASAPRPVTGAGRMPSRAHKSDELLCKTKKGILFYCNAVPKGNLFCAIARKITGLCAKTTVVLDPKTR